MNNGKKKISSTRIAAASLIVAAMTGSNASADAIKGVTSLGTAPQVRSAIFETQGHEGATGTTGSSGHTGSSGKSGEGKCGEGKCGETKK